MHVPMILVANFQQGIPKLGLQAHTGATAAGEHVTIDEGLAAKKDTPLAGSSTGP
jgi:hypothetical protein